MEQNTVFYRYNMQLQALRLLWDPILLSHGVLETLGLNFTDDLHVKNEEFICWLFWNAVAKTMNLHFLRFGWPFDDDNRRLRVGLGCRKVVVPWLKLIADELELGATGCHRRTWQKTRDAVVCSARELGDRSEATTIVTKVTRSFEGNDFNVELRSIIRSAIEEARCQVQGLGSDETPSAIYLDFAVVFPPIPTEPITRSMLTELLGGDPRLNDILQDEIIDEFNNRTI